MGNYFKYKKADMNRLKNRKIACLTLDLEQDHGGLLDKPEYHGFSVIDPLVEFLKNKNIPLTCFVQGSLFESHPNIIDKFSSIQTEFELHTYKHSEYEVINHEYEIKTGKIAYENYFGYQPKAYRSQAGIISEKLFTILSSEGFKFDSSVIPAFRPGVYNGLDNPTVPHLLCESQIFEFPVSTSVFKIPISLSYLKLMGRIYFKLLEMSNLPDLVIFCFHLHDLQLLKSSKNIPYDHFPLHHKIAFKRTYSSDNGFELLKEFVEMLSRKGYSFSDLNTVYELLGEF